MFAVGLCDVWGQTVTWDESRFVKLPWLGSGLRVVACWLNIALSFACLFSTHKIQPDVRLPDAPLFQRVCLGDNSAKQQQQKTMAEAQPQAPKEEAAAPAAAAAAATPAAAATAKPAAPEPIYVTLNSDNQQATEIESLCMNCYKQGTTRLLFLNVSTATSLPCPSTTTIASKQTDSIL